MSRFLSKDQLEGFEKYKVIEKYNTKVLKKRKNKNSTKLKF